jgi:hypothetical protein
MNDWQGKPKYSEKTCSVAALSITKVFENWLIDETEYQQFQSDACRIVKGRSFMGLFALQIRHRFGCYDEITEVDRRRVRHCNWVRFLRAASTYSDEVNMIGTKVKGKSHFTVTLNLL